MISLEKPFVNYSHIIDLNRPSPSLDVQCIYRDLVSRMLDKTPALRATAEECLGIYNGIEFMILY